jgi:hypothetical protein
MVWAAGQSDCKCNAGDANQAFLKASMTDHVLLILWIATPRVGLLQVANAVYGFLQACYSWCETLDSFLNDAGAVHFETDPRSVILVRRDKAGQLLETLSHAHEDEFKIIGQQVRFLMTKIEA